MARRILKIVKKKNGVKVQVIGHRVHARQRRHGPLVEPVPEQASSRGSPRAGASRRPPRETAGKRVEDSVMRGHCRGVAPLVDWPGLMTIPRETDVLILGGGSDREHRRDGPSRERASGRSLIEAERHPALPRGESLLPHSLPCSTGLGVHDAIRALPHTLVKPGRPSAATTARSEPASGSTRAPRRSSRTPTTCGATSSTSCCCGRAGNAAWTCASPGRRSPRNGRARASPASACGTEDGDEGTIRAKCVLDATGQHAFLATRMGWKTVYPDHRKLAIVGHFEGCPSA